MAGSMPKHQNDNLPPGITFVPLYDVQFSITRVKYRIECKCGAGRTIDRRQFLREFLSKHRKHMPEWANITPSSLNWSMAEQRVKCMDLDPSPPAIAERPKNEDKEHWMSREVRALLLGPGTQPALESITENRLRRTLKRPRAASRSSREESDEATEPSGGHLERGEACQLRQRAPPGGKLLRRESGAREAPRLLQPSPVRRRNLSVRGGGGHAAKTSILLQERKAGGRPPAWLPALARSLKPRLHILESPREPTGTLGTGEPQGLPSRPRGRAKPVAGPLLGVRASWLLQKPGPADKPATGVLRLASKLSARSLGSGDTARLGGAPGQKGGKPGLERSHATRPSPLSCGSSAGGRLQRTLSYNHLVRSATSETHGETAALCQRPLSRAQAPGGGSGRGGHVGSGRRGRPPGGRGTLRGPQEYGQVGRPMGGASPGRGAGRAVLGPGVGLSHGDLGRGREGRAAARALPAPIGEGAGAGPIVRYQAECPCGTNRSFENPKGLEVFFADHRTHVLGWEMALSTDGTTMKFFPIGSAELGRSALLPPPNRQTLSRVPQRMGPETEGEAPEGVPLMSEPTTPLPPWDNGHPPRSLSEKLSASPLQLPLEKAPNSPQSPTVSHAKRREASGSRERSPIECDNCGLRLAHGRNLERHLRSCREAPPSGSPSPYDIPIDCPYCGRHLAHSRNLERHLRSCEDPRAKQGLPAAAPDAPQGEESKPFKEEEELLLQAPEGIPPDTVLHDGPIVRMDSWFYLRAAMSRRVCTVLKGMPALQKAILDDSDRQWDLDIRRQGQKPNYLYYFIVKEYIRENNLGKGDNVLICTDSKGQFRISHKKKVKAQRIGTRVQRGAAASNRGGGGHPAASPSVSGRMVGAAEGNAGEASGDWGLRRVWEPLPARVVKESQRSSHVRWGGFTPRRATSDDTDTVFTSQEISLGTSTRAGTRLRDGQRSPRRAVAAVQKFCGTAAGKSAEATSEGPGAWVRVLRVFTWVLLLGASVPPAGGPQDAGLDPYECPGFLRLCGLVFVLDLQRFMVWLRIPASHRHTGLLNQPMLFDENVNVWGQRWRV